MSAHVVEAETVVTFKMRLDASHAGVSDATMFYVSDIPMLILTWSQYADRACDTKLAVSHAR